MTLVIECADEQAAREIRGFCISEGSALYPTVSERNEQISALKAKVKRLTAELAGEKARKTIPYQSHRHERDALKHENAELRQALAWIRDVACGEAQVAEDDEHGMLLIWRRSLEALDAARKEQG